MARWCAFTPATPQQINTVSGSFLEGGVSLRSHDLVAALVKFTDVVFPY